MTGSTYSSQASHFQKRSQHWATVVILALLLSSCQQQTEAEHLEHATPEHRPANYSEAVTQLQQRITQIQENASSESNNQQQLAELGDIIRWLPMIAADSDLKRAEWEHVQLISQRLSTWPALSADQRQLSAQQTDSDLEALRSLVDASARFSPKVVEINLEEEYQSSTSDAPSSLQ